MQCVTGYTARYNAIIIICVKNLIIHYYMYVEVYNYLFLSKFKINKHEKFIFSYSCINNDVSKL